MLSPEQIEALASRIEKLSCIDPASGDGLFSFVFLGENGPEAEHFDAHVKECEYCRNAREIYRYKRDVAKLMGKQTRGK